MSSGRIGWIDNARGIGIILVVMGHIVSNTGSFPLSYVIYAFHMPLFVFLTTILMKDQNWLDVLRGKIKSLIIPYFTYLIMVGIICAPMEFYNSMKGGIIFSARLFLGGNFLFNSFGAFWYVPALYVSLIVYSFLKEKIAKGRQARDYALMLGMFLIAYVISYAKVSFPVPYALHTAPAIVGLIWIGRMVPWMSRPALLSSCALAIIALAIAIDVQSTSPRFIFNLKNADIGLPVVGILVALAGSQVVFMVSRLLSCSQMISVPLGYIGKITLPILFLHQGVHFFLLYMGFVNGWDVFLISLCVPIAFALVIQTAIPRVASYFGIPTISKAQASSPS